MNVVYIVCAVAGFVLLAAGLLFDDVFDALDGIELGDWASVPVLGAALGAFGIAGWVTLGAVGNFSLLFAFGAAGAFARGAWWFVGKVRDGATDATPRSTDLVGTPGKIVTPVAGGRGEVLVRLAGQPRKLTALSEGEHALGDQVVVIEAVSDSSVRVVSQDEFWGTGDTANNHKGEEPT
jgi:membrane protein implicated in regulation of membrane protease activity